MSAHTQGSPVRLTPCGSTARAPKYCGAASVSTLSACRSCVWPKVHAITSNPIDTTCHPKLCKHMVPQMLTQPARGSHARKRGTRLQPSARRLRVQLSRDAARPGRPRRLRSESTPPRRASRRPCRLANACAAACSLRPARPATAQQPAAAPRSGHPLPPGPADRVTSAGSYGL